MADHTTGWRAKIEQVKRALQQDQGRMLRQVRRERLRKRRLRAVTTGRRSRLWSERIRHQSRITLDKLAATLEQSRSVKDDRPEARFSMLAMREAG